MWSKLGDNTSEVGTDASSLANHTSHTHTTTPATPPPLTELSRSNLDKLALLPSAPPLEQAEQPPSTTDATAPATNDAPSAKPPGANIDPIRYVWPLTLANLYESRIPLIAHSLGIGLVWYLVGRTLTPLGDSIAPGGTGWALALLYACSVASDAGLRRLSPRIPPLLGSLVAGLALRNWPFGSLLASNVPLAGQGFEWWSPTIRTCALSVIMLRAGLGLDLQKLRSQGWTTARLASLPCLVEALVVALLSAPLLGLPSHWGALLGFIVAAVSPAVVVPGLLELQSSHYGTSKGIPSMVIAAASLDDVIAIAGFSVALTLALPGASDLSASSAMLGESSSGSSLLAGTANTVAMVADLSGSSGAFHLSTADKVVFLLVKAPLELAAAVVIGAFFGSAVATPAASSVSTPQRVYAAVGSALLCVFGGKHLNLAGGGVLASVVVGCAAARGWVPHQLGPVKESVNRIWSRLQPALFGLLGASVDISLLQPSHLAAGVGLVALSLTARILATWIAVSPWHRRSRSHASTDLNRQEVWFVCVAWMPKATVQAAVGSIALDRAIELGLDEIEEGRARLVLTLSVLVILITAPIGAIAIATFGPRWLTKEDLSRRSVRSEQEC